MTKLQVKGLSAQAVLISILFFSAGFAVSDPGWVRRAILLAGAEGLVSFFFLARTIGRSDRFFYSALGGGMLGRLTLLGLFTALLIRLSIPAAAPLLTLVLTYFACSIVQIPFLSGSIHGFHRDSRTSSS